MTEYTRFIDTIRRALQKEGYTARQLALEVRVDPSYISRVLAGERNPPSARVVEKIAHVLHLDPDELVIEAGRFSGFLRASGPLTDEDLKALRRVSERIRQRHRETKLRKEK